MGTLKQKKLAEAIVDNIKNKKPLNKKQLLVSAGYDETTAEATPERTIQQKGVQEELQAMGFNEESAKKVVQSIMLDQRVKPDSRLKATDQVFKVHGSYAPDKIDHSGTVNLDGLNAEQKEALLALIQ